MRGGGVNLSCSAALLLHTKWSACCGLPRGPRRSIFPPLAGRRAGPSGRSACSGRHRGPRHSRHRGRLLHLQPAQVSLPPPPFLSQCQLTLLFIPLTPRWCCTPKGTALLWAHPDCQSILVPTVTSHGYGLGPRAEFMWQVSLREGVEGDWEGTELDTDRMDRRGLYAGGRNHGIVLVAGCVGGVGVVGLCGSVLGRGGCGRCMCGAGSTVALRPLGFLRHPAPSSH